MLLLQILEEWYPYAHILFVMAYFLISCYTLLSFHWLEPKKNSGLMVGCAHNNAGFVSSGMVLTF
jgi:hypothetical protein